MFANIGVENVNRFSSSSLHNFPPFFPKQKSISLNACSTWVDVFLADQLFELSDVTRMGKLFHLPGTFFLLSTANKRHLFSHKLKPFELEGKLTRMRDFYYFPRRIENKKTFPFHCSSHDEYFEKLCAKKSCRFRM